MCDVKGVIQSEKLMQTLQLPSALWSFLAPFSSLFWFSVSISSTLFPAAGHRFYQTTSDTVRD